MEHRNSLNSKQGKWPTGTKAKNIQVLLSMLAEVFIWFGVVGCSVVGCGVLLFGWLENFDFMPISWPLSTNPVIWPYLFIDKGL